MGRSLLGAFCAAALAGAMCQGACAAEHKILFSFCDSTLCPDSHEGNFPLGGLLRDGTGTLYGTTTGGGAASPPGGTIYSLTPNGDTWQYQRLYSFCTAIGCPGGDSPETGLIADTQGNLYGTTITGEKLNGGAVFELMPNPHRTKWKLKVLHDFCASGCTDGAWPNARLTYQGAASGAPYDGVSPLYGTTAQGGGSGSGTVFTLTPKNGGRNWAEKIIYDFCPGQDCTDGKTPGGGAIVDGSGALFVNAASGGDKNAGTVIELKPGKRNWTETRLYSFCAAANCDDGSTPAGQLLQDASGNLFGTASAGGDHGAGVLFKLVPVGSGYQESVLHNFCQSRRCNDGETPLDGVTMDPSGNLVGVASQGGPRLSGGTAFVFGNGSLDVLYHFCPKSVCSDGFEPRGLPVLDSQGDIFGTTAAGGAFNAGTVYEITP